MLTGLDREVPLSSSKWVPPTLVACDPTGGLSSALAKNMLNMGNVTYARKTCRCSPWVFWGLVSVRHMIRMERAYSPLGAARAEGEGDRERVGGDGPR